MRIKHLRYFHAIIRLTKISILIFILSAIIACATTPPDPSMRPGWIDNPPDGNLSAIGSASYEIFGESWARERATKLALAELALQKGSSVEISGEVSNRQTVSGSNVTEQASVSTKAIIRGEEVSVNAKIEKFWKDRQGKKVWVLLREK